MPKIWKIFDDLENDSIEKKLSREEAIVTTYRSIDFPLKRIRNAKNIYIYIYTHTYMYVCIYAQIKTIIAANSLFRS